MAEIAGGVDPDAEDAAGHSTAAHTCFLKAVLSGGKPQTSQQAMGRTPAPNLQQYISGHLIYG